MISAGHFSLNEEHHVAQPVCSNPLLLLLLLLLLLQVA
jgi:hypothetical protein